MSNYYNRQWRLPNAWNGTESNVSKQSNYSLSFDGTQNIEIDSIGPTISAMTEISISAWIKTTSSAFSYILFTGRYSTGSIGLGLISGTVYGVVGTPPGGFSDLQTTATVNDDNWHHLVMTFNNSNGVIQVYIDGSLDPTSSTTSGLVPTNIIYADIGQRAYNNDFRFNGQIDGLAIFDYELSSSQVTTLYGSSSTGIGNPMAISGGGKPVAYYPLGDQDSFNGSNYLVPNSSLKDYVFSFPSSGVNYIRLGSSGVNIGQQNTISIWVNFNGTIGDDLLISTYAGNWMINPAANGGYLCYGATQGTTAYACVGSLTYPTGWFLLTVVRNNTNFSVYFNDQLQGSNSNSNFTSDTVVGMIGSSAAGKWTHDVSNLTLFNTALSATGANSVETLYNNGSPLTSMSGFTSLQGWWKLDASATWDSSNSWWAIPDDSTNSNTTESFGLTQSALEQSDLSFTSSYSPYALDFDGANDYVSAGRVLGAENTSTLSVSFWLKIPSTGAKSYLGYFIGSFGAGWLVEADAHSIYFAIGDTGTGYQSFTLPYSGNININTWYHICMVYDGNETGSANILKVYINGTQKTLIGSPSFPASIPTLNATAEFTIGGIKPSAVSGQKTTSNVSVFNSALTSSQVREIYNEGVPSNLNNHSAYSNLVSWWQLGSNSSWVNPDWTVLDEKGSNNGTSSNMGEDAIVDGVGSYANGLSSGMGGDEVVGDAPYSTANALSVNMGVEDRVTDTPS